MRLGSFSSRSKGRGVSNAPTFFISGIRNDGPVYFETLMAEGAQAGQFRDDFADYAALLQRLGESAHQSCAVLTSREKPAVLGPLEGRTAPVRSLLLQGVDVAAGPGIPADPGGCGRPRGL